MYCKSWKAKFGKLGCGHGYCRWKSRGQRPSCNLRGQRHSCNLCGKQTEMFIAMVLPVGFHGNCSVFSDAKIMPCNIVTNQAGASCTLSPLALGLKYLAQVPKRT